MMVKKAVVEDYKTPCAETGERGKLVEVDGEWVKKPLQKSAAAKVETLNELASKLTQPSKT